MGTARQQGLLAAICAPLRGALGMGEPGPSAYVGMLAIASDLFGLGVISPLLPFIVPARWVGIILTGQFIAVVIGQVVLGAISERLGRRRVLVLVMGMDAILFGLTLFTKPVSLFCVRVAVGLLPVSLSISWVTDVSASKPRPVYARKFAHVGLAFNLGGLLGAACGGLLGPERWVVANVLSAAPCALACVWALLSSDPVSVLAEGASKAVRGVRATVSALPYRISLGQFLMSGSILGAFFSLAPVLLATTYAASATEIAAVSLSSAAWNILNNQFAIRPLLRWLGALRIVALLSVIATLANAALAVRQAHEITTYSLYTIVYVSAALAVTVLNMMSSAYALRYGENAVGTINGISRSLFSTGFGISPAVSVSLWQWRPWASFALAACCWLVAGSCTAYVALSGDPDPVPGRMSSKGATAATHEGAEGLRGAGAERGAAGRAGRGGHSRSRRAASANPSKHRRGRRRAASGARRAAWRSNRQRARQLRARWQHAGVRSRRTRSTQSESVSSVPVCLRSRNPCMLTHFSLHFLFRAARKRESDLGRPGPRAEGQPTGSHARHGRQR
jgi:MFS family permease